MSLFDPKNKDMMDVKEFESLRKSLKLHPMKGFFQEIGLDTGH